MADDRLDDRAHRDDTTRLDGTAHPDDSAHLDGNALAGPLSEILSVEATTAWWRCPQCARSGALAQLHVYGPEPGLTARCPGCAHVALRLVREGEYIWLSMGGSTGAFRFRTV